MQVGSALRSWRYPWAFHDDDGENISERNPLYCELTTQYWAWKNIDAQYYGFCHYRRYFDFSEERHVENAFGEVMAGRIDEASQKRFALDDESVRAAVEGYDVITTEFKDLRRFPSAGSTPREHWKSAKALIPTDFDKMMGILVDRHPDYAEDVQAYMDGNFSRFCNMFIMRKEIFHDYCAWLFPLLEEFVSTVDFSRRSIEALRTPGHLAERLLNVYLSHAERMGKNWKTKQVQCVHFEHPGPRGISQ